MNIEEFREFCLSLPHAEEYQPWTEPQYQMPATFTIGVKWFCIVDMDMKFIDAKFDPEQVKEMQSRYKDAFPAWHMNKEHWLGIWLESDVPDYVIKSLIQDGYSLIVKHLPNKKRTELGID